MSAGGDLNLEAKQTDVTFWKLLDSSSLSHDLVCDDFWPGLGKAWLMRA